MVLGKAVPPWDPLAGFVDTSSVVLRYTPFVMSPRNQTVNIGDTVTFSVAPNGLAAPGSTFTWEFRDSTTTVVPDSVARHPFSHSGTFTVRVSLRNAQSTLIGRDSVTLVVSPPPHWAWNLSSATLTSSSPPPGLATRGDTTEQDSVTSALNDLHAHPDNWLIFAADSAGCQGVALEQFPNGEVITGSLIQSAERTALGVTSSCIQPQDPDVGTLSIGTIGSGTIVGNFTPQNRGGDNIGFLGGSINAQMAPMKLTGTFTWIIWFSTGYASYTFTFTADQL